MSLNLIPCRTQYTGNGTTTAFATGFYFLYNSQVTVTLTDASGNNTTLTQGMDYTVTGAGSSGGGTVTCTVAPTAGYLVTVLRVTPNTQTTTFVPNDELPAASLENGLDLLTMQQQELTSPGGSVDRAIKFPITEPPGFTPILPTIQQRAGKQLGFDPNGNFLAFNNIGKPRGNWVTATAYNFLDIVSNSANQNLYAVTQNYTSGATIAGDISSGYLTLLINSTALVGPTGPAGTNGTNGTNGAAATIAVGTTTTGSPGTSASVTNSGSSSAATFNFTIPAGQTGTAGSAATIAVGTVNTGTPGSSATVSNSGSSSAAVFNFSIPQGAAGTGGFASVKKQIFTSSGTYTPSTGMAYCIVEAVGGGGNGGPATTSSTANACAGGGGSSGDYVRSVLTATTVGASKTVTIGAASGTTSLGSLVIALGGVVGVTGSETNSPFQAQGGNNSGSSTGDVVIRGQSGGNGVNYGTPIMGIGGAGGSNLFGAGGKQVIAYGGTYANFAQSGAGALGYGSGGGGASAAASTSGSATGGSAASGIIIITEFCN